MEPLESRTLLTGGQLDQNFGTGGLVTTDFRSGLDQVTDIAVQADGKVVAVGSTSGTGSPSNPGDFAVARYNTNGTLDTTFGTGGLVNTDIALNSNDRATGVAIQSDGKVVVVGTSSGVADFVVVRYNANGTLDPSFGPGTTGVVTTDLGGTDAASAVAIQSNGAIVVAGNTNNDFSLFRYLPTGLPDTNFGGTGRFITDVSGTDVARTLLIQPSGNFLVGGTANSRFAIVSVNASGSGLDASFGTGGKVTTAIPSQNSADLYDLARQADGSIVAVGEATAAGGKKSFALARYSAGGVLDTSFNGSGTVVSSFTTGDVARGVVIAPNGKILVAGTSSPGTFRVVRYDQGGTIDTSFGTSGSSVVTFSGAATASAIALANASSVVVAGSVVGTTSDFGLARVLLGNPNGDFEFGNTIFTVREGTPVAQITVNRANGSLGAVTVNFATSNGTAQAGVHYTATSLTLSFAAGETSKTVDIPILNDGVASGTRTVNLALTNPTGGATLGDRPTATLNILDAFGSLQFGSATFSAVASSGFATIFVTRTGGAGGPVTINFTTVAGAGTAQPGVDYVPTSGLLNFGDGELTKSFTVPLLNNPASSGVSTVGLALSSPGGGATLGTPSMATLSIIASPGSFVFRSATFASTEGTFATVFVDRINGTGGTSTVQYATSDGTGKAGLNYVRTFGALSFGPGETSKSFTVQLLADGQISGNLGVNLSLSSPAGGATLGGRKDAVLIIQDSPGALQFASGLSFARESSTVTMVTVNRSVGIGGLVTVNFATSDGTARAGTDYLGTSGTLTFAPGETSKSFPILILNDGQADGINKTIGLTLSSPAGGATLGATSTSALMILGNQRQAQPGDYNGDRLADLSLFRPASDQWFISSLGIVQFGQQGDIPVPGIYDGNRRTEVATYQPSTALWYILGPAGPRIIQLGTPQQDVPVPADYDADGTTDLAVYNPFSGRWLINGSSTGLRAMTFGAPQLDRPIPADYDADGQADLAVFRSATGEWIINGSKVGLIVTSFGLPNVDQPIPADYDADGKTDLALFRPPTAEWIIQPSTTGGVRVSAFGDPGDIPMPLDYDGDNAADIGVYRPTKAIWYLQLSQGPLVIAPFGQADADIPAEPPFAFRPSGSKTSPFLPRTEPASVLSPGGSGSDPGSATGAAALALAVTPPTSPLDVHDNALAAIGSRKAKATHRLLP